MSKQDIPVILHNDNRGLLSVEDGQLEVLQLSADGRPPKRLLSCPTRLVLRANLARDTADDKPRRLDLHTLGQKNERSHQLTLKKIHVLVESTHQADAEEWVDVLMEAAYPVTRPYRKVLLLVNPVGGKGKARQIVKEEVLPIFEAAWCKVDMRETTHRDHATEIARDMTLDYDVIATASGDGIIYEVLNGFGQRPDAKRALRTPIAPLPTGSGCAACVNLFGIKDSFNMPLAVLNAIKGQPMAIDLCSILVQPSGERKLSFLSAALGLMVELDIGTENLRWMGDTRFTYGFLRGVVQSKTLKVRLKLDVITDDKEGMASEARKVAAHERGHKGVGGGTDPLALIRGVQTIALAEAPVQPEAAAAGKAKETVENDDNDPNGPLPPAVPLVPDDSWLTIESTGEKTTPLKSGSPSPTKLNFRRASQRSVHGHNNHAHAHHHHPHPHRGGWEEGFNMLYLYSGLMPWVSRDLNQWPVTQAGSGTLEVAIQRVAPRKVLLDNMTGADQGEPYWDDSCHYYKVRGYTAENLDKVAQPKFTIDGEGFDFDSFHVQVLPKAACMLSLDGRFFHSDFVGKHHTHGSGKKKTGAKQHAVGAGPHASAHKRSQSIERRRSSLAASRASQSHSAAHSSGTPGSG